MNSTLLHFVRLFHPLSSTERLTLEHIKEMQDAAPPTLRAAGRTRRKTSRDTRNTFQTVDDHHERKTSSSGLTWSAREKRRIVLMSFSCAVAAGWLFRRTQRSQAVGRDT